MNLPKHFRYALPVAVIVVTGAFGPVQACGELNRCNPVEIDGHVVCTTITRAEP